MRRYRGPSDRVQRDRRWPALRQAARRRDDWQCVKCGHRGRIEVDHIRPVRDYPELAFELSNLQCLCPRCHSTKTRIEVGFKPENPERRKWRMLVRDLSRENRKIT